MPEIEDALNDKSLPHSKLFLKTLDRRGIIAAVEGCSRSERSKTLYGLEVEDHLAEEIADDLLADPESPVAPTLQILLSKLWSETKRLDDCHPRFTHDLYLRLKRDGILLQDFLNQQLAAVEQWRPKVTHSGLALDLLAFHTTPKGTARQRLEQEVLQTYAHSAETLPDLVQRLKDDYVLADIPSAAREPVKGSRLAHDTLAPLVRERFEKSDLPGQRARRILESRAVDWADGRVGAVLDEADLKIVEAGGSGMRTRTSHEERLAAASRAEVGRRQRARRRWYGAAVLSLLLIVAAGLIATWGWRESVQSAQVALLNESRVLSVLAETEAKDSPATAVRVALAALPKSLTSPSRPYFRGAEGALYDSMEKIQELCRFEGQTAVFSPNGRNVVTASRDNTARLWDAATCKELAVFRHEGTVRTAAFGPDSREIVTASDDGTARLWEVASGKQLALLRHDKGVNSAAFSPDGRTLVTASDDKTARIWDAVLGQQTAVFRHDNAVKTAALSPNGRALLAVEGDQDYGRYRGGTARLWDVFSGKQITAEPTSGAALESAFSPDGHILAVPSDDGTIGLLAVETGKEVAELRGHEDWVGSAAFNPDGRTIVTASADHTARLWDASTAREIGVLHHDFAVSYAGFSPDGRLVVTLPIVFASQAYSGMEDHTARLWDVSSRQEIDEQGGQKIELGPGEEIAVLRDHKSDVDLAAFSPDSRLLVTVSWGIRRFGSGP